MPKNFFNSARISEEHLSIALSQVKLGFWDLDLDSRLIVCTIQNRVNFGLPLQGILTEESIINTILPEDRRRRREAIAKAMDPMAPTYDLEIRVRLPDQEIRWLQVRGTVIFENENPVRIIGTTVDISERKGIEILRDELLNITTHELKSPLSVVKGYLQLLTKFIAGIGDQKHLLIAERALGASTKVERLMDEVTGVRFPGGSEMLLKKEPFDLRELILEIKANTGVINPQADIRLCTTTRRFSVRADKYRIAQVLTNLLNNAIKYSPGEPLIGIEISQDGPALRVTITDKGIGLDPDEHEKVFEKFYRVKASSELTAGSGIGLFLCSEIIIRHGGKIGMLPNPSGKGLVAFFTLPL